jgi:hypothetical protein
VFPQGRRCPACDGDEVAAQVIAAATASAIEQAPPPRPHRRGALMATAAVIAFVLALGATVAAIASPGGATPASPSPASGSGGAAQVRE